MRGSGRGTNRKKAASAGQIEPFTPNDLNKLAFWMATGSGKTLLMHCQDQQTIAFLDPKGLRNFTDTFNNPKVQIARGIKDLEKNLKRDDIRLESYLISQTPRNQLRWPSPSDPTRQAQAAEYLAHHILLAKDEPDHYIQTLLERLQSN